MFSTGFSSGAREGRKVRVMLSGTLSLPAVCHPARSRSRTAWAPSATLREIWSRFAAFDAEFVRWVKENEEARWLMTIPGVGVIVASALVAAVVQAESFERGRDLAGWLGLVPRQFTTGGKPKLLGISKRGNKYLRRQLIHGARAALPYVAERDTPLGRWAKGLASRAHRNVAIVAFANKLAETRLGSAAVRRTVRRHRKRDCQKSCVRGRLAITL